MHLCPYLVFSYICRFNGNQKFIYYIEHKWKDNVIRLRSQGINDPFIWSLRGGNKFLNIDLSNYGISETMYELYLIHLFKY